MNGASENHKLCTSIIFIYDVLFMRIIELKPSKLMVACSTVIC